MTDAVAKKVLLIGWDAADWAMIRPLMAKGQMPTLTRLIEGGVSGNLATIQPMLSPMLWNSIATGKRADKHGILGFTEPKPDATGIRPVTSTSRRCRAIWNILSHHGLRSNVVGWFASHPAEPIRGTVVTDHYVARAMAQPAQLSFNPGTFYPEHLGEALAGLCVDPRQLNRDALLPFIPLAAQIDQKKDPRLMKLAMLLARVSTLHAAACRIMCQEPWDFMAIYYDAIDQFGHVFMPYHGQRMTAMNERDAQLYGDVMNGCYRFHDMMLAALLRYAGPDTTVVLVSDHGFHSGPHRPSINGLENPEQWHRPYGVACVSGPGVKKNQRLYGATILDVTPTIMAMLGLAIGGDMDGRPWLEIFEKPVNPDRVVSWDMIEGDFGTHAPDQREDPVASAESIHHLVELGYIDPPSDDAQKTIKSTTRVLKTNLGLALNDSRRAHQAVPVWEGLIRDYPNEPWFAVQLARCRLRLDHYDQARGVLEGLEDRVTQTAVVQLMLGQIHLGLRRPDQALEHLQRAQANGPDRGALDTVIGQAYAQLSQWDEAQDAFNRAIGYDSDDAHAHAGLASVALARGDNEEALEHALHAVGLRHHLPSGHYLLGRALAGLGLADQAIQAFETCLGMAPGMKQAHLWLAKLCREDDRHESRVLDHEIMAGSSSFNV